MSHQKLIVLLIVASFCCGHSTWTLADEVRYYEQNGVTYRETKQIVQRSVSETRMQPTSRAVYREQVTTEYRNAARTVLVPVTEYRYQTYQEGFWSPFGAPYYATYLVPLTRWEQRTETVNTPVTCRRWVPQCETTQVPITAQRTIPQEIITRVALTPSNPSLASSPSPLGSASVPTLAPSMPPSPTPAANGAIGGVARLDQDPPRYGTSAALRTSATPTR